ncbi:protein asteroid homolog 1-like [Hydractinia symbiolongicarpus]|uniref:protein asteroid homolog 1-like n=1 Tax=Hydractinia symbiolongicarpus TaxID=13093 RepID=UPI0025519E2E|nr:protein asteroid homolog 1-like [Hydractinia symbiolongicarpus]
MGVTQLTTYVEEHHNVLFKQKVDVKGKCLMFDGNCLYHKLSRKVPARCGGDYHMLYTVFQKYFETLRQWHVAPYVVLDGGSNIPIKNNTICQRREKEIKVIQKLAHKSDHSLPKPVLTMEIFIEVMQDMKINFVVAKKEADLAVAALANKINCPVVSLDSDFFLTNVIQGVIKLDSVLYASKALLYKRSYLADHLQLSETMLPMLGVILGNDYSTEQLLRQIQQSCGACVKSINSRVTLICNYLRKFTCPDNVVDDICSRNKEIEVALQEEISTILREFDVDIDQEDCNAMYTILLTQKTSLKQLDYVDIKSREEYVYNMCSFGLLSPFAVDICTKKTHFVKIQCENYERKASCELSTELRCYIYAILLATSPEDQICVKEFRRAGNYYKQFDIELTLTEMQRIPLDIILGKYSNKDKQRYLCDLVQFPFESLIGIQGPYVLFLLSLKYWIQATFRNGINLQVELIQSLLIAFTYYCHSSSPLKFKQRRFDVDVAHHFCSWQSIFYYLRFLNDLIARPFQCPPSKSIFNGGDAHCVYQSLRTGEAAENLLTSSQRQLYDEFFKIVTSGVMECIVVKEARKGSKKKRSQVKVVKKKECKQENRFAALMVPDDEEPSNEIDQ